MGTVFDKLREAREVRGLTLDDIAASTRIQRRTLQALEEGNIANIPRTYLRAFLRSFAKEVGLDGGEILQEFEQSEKTAAPSVQNQPVAAKVVIPGSRNIVPLFLSVVLIVLLTLSLSLLNGEDETPVKEIPFSDVVRQTTATARSDTDAVVAPLLTPDGRTPPEPLVLRAMTFDTVWIQITIDGKTQREYIAPPRWSMQWKADEYFIISLGNAGAITFVLNNTPLGMLGAPGKTVKNYRIERPRTPLLDTAPVQ